MKIWVDDIRLPPLGWVWCKTSVQAITTLENAKGRNAPVEIMSLDHDLGMILHMQKGDTTRSVVLWMCENDFWPNEVKVHSANPVGIEWLEGMIARYKP